jgi:hypothetical protein
MVGVGFPDANLRRATWATCCAVGQRLYGRTGRRVVALFGDDDIGRGPPAAAVWGRRIRGWSLWVAVSSRARGQRFSIWAAGTGELIRLLLSGVDCVIAVEAADPVLHLLVTVFPQPHGPARRRRWCGEPVPWCRGLTDVFVTRALTS